jgi:SAM-dependent methyltransferase
MVYISTIQDDRALIQDGPVYWDKNSDYLTSADLNDIKDSWELLSLQACVDDWAAVQRNANDVLDRLENFGKPNGKLLDFGCGWGFFLGCAKERGWDIFGLEPLPAHAVYTRAKFGATVVTDTLRDETFEDDFFDVITSIQVFEHLLYPSEDLSKLYRTLKPGGIIVIEVPNIDNFLVRLLKSGHRHFVADHLNFFSPHTLQLLLEKYNFKVLDAYNPWRYMSVRHFITWMYRYLPGPFCDRLASLAHQTNLEKRLLRINLGDIVTEIAEK